MGTLFGKYTPVRALVISPAGEAHLALMDTGTVQRQVVLKVLLPPFAPERVELFMRDVRATAPTLHPSVLRPLDFGQQGDRAFVVIEPAVGLTLGQVLLGAQRLGRRLSFEFVAAAASQLCAGLAHVHTRSAPDGTPLRLVHCDISPKHLLACEGGLVKLIGFGMARARGLQAAPTRADGQVEAIYLSPEQLTGKHEPDARSDLFALGAVLWELVAGKPPFQARSLAEIADALEQPAPPLTMVTRDVPLDLADAISRSLELDPEARFGSADEMRRTFDAVLARRGAHHPLAVIDAELKALRRAGLTLEGFAAGPVPSWFLESLGFDREVRGPLPQGTPLEGEAQVSSRDGVPTQVVPPHLAGAVPGAIPGETPEVQPALTPDEAWGDFAPPAAGPAPAAALPAGGARAAAAAPAPAPAIVAPGSLANELDEDAPRQGGGAKLLLVAVLSAAVGAAGGFVAPRYLAQASPAGAAASAAVPMTALEMVSTPPGARVWLDGVDTEKVTPVRLEVAPGRKHGLLLKHPDCLDWTLEVEAPAEKVTPVEAGLTRAARIAVRTEPPGAQVEIDDAPGFATPGQSAPLKAGARRVLVRKPGFLAQKSDVAVRDGDVLQLEFKLVPGAEVAVKSAPSGAEIWVDGEDSGVKTPGTVGVAAGKPHVVSVRRAGYVGQARRVAALEAGKASALELPLDNVLAAELVKRIAARVKDRTVAEKKRDDAARRAAGRKTSASERELAAAEAALDEVNLDLSELQLQLRAHERVR